MNDGRVVSKLYPLGEFIKPKRLQSEHTKSQILTGEDHQYAMNNDNDQDNNIPLAGGAPQQPPPPPGPLPPPGVPPPAVNGPAVRTENICVMVLRIRMPNTINFAKYAPPAKV